MWNWVKQIGYCQCLSLSSNELISTTFVVHCWLFYQKWNQIQICRWSLTSFMSLCSSSIANSLILYQFYFKLLNLYWISYNGKFCFSIVQPKIWNCEKVLYRKKKYKYYQYHFGNISLPIKANQSLFQSISINWKQQIYLSFSNSIIFHINMLLNLFCIKKANSLSKNIQIDWIKLETRILKILKI